LKSIGKIDPIFYTLEGEHFSVDRSDFSGEDEKILSVFAIID